MTRGTHRFIWGLVAACLSTPAMAQTADDLRFGEIFASHAVLQRDTELVIWGDAAPRARLSIAIADRKLEARADTSGHWAVKLAALGAGGPYQLSVSDTQGHRASLDDLLIGDVWLCGGQSNMEFQLSHATNAWNEIHTTNNPQLRFANVPKEASATPSPRLKAPLAWKAVTPDTAGDASAVCYHMAKALQAALKIPVGFINASWGGTPAQGWIPESDLRRQKSFDAGLDLLDRYAHNPADPSLRSVPSAPWNGDNNSLAVLYNGMIAPLASYRFKGIAWYQGESNWSAPGQYADLLPMVIGSWRRTFDTPDLPFLVVQLPNYGTPQSQPGDSAWATLRDIQRKTVLAIPHAGLAVTLDVGDRLDLHPTEKTAVGQRLALLARRIVYGEATPVSPSPRSVRRQGNDLVVDFNDTDGALQTFSGDRALGFELCSTSGDCHWNDARADHESVVLIGANRPAVTRIRYAWADAPFVNLFGRSGLPVGTFELAVPPQ